MANKKTRSFKQIIAEYWFGYQASLFPFLSGVVEEPLTGKLERLVVVWDIVQIEQHVGIGVIRSHGAWTGRPERHRRIFALRKKSKAR